MGKRKRQEVKEFDPPNESASKKRPSQTEEEQPDRDPISKSKHNTTMPKTELRDIFNNPGLRHISIKIFSYLDFKDHDARARYDDNSDLDSWDIDDLIERDNELYGPHPSYGDLQTCRLVCKAWRQLLETSRLYWIKRLFYEHKHWDHDHHQIIVRYRRSTIWREAFESAKIANKWQWQDIKGLVLTLEKYVKGTHEHKILPERDWRNIDPLHYFVKTYRYYSIEDLEPIKIIIKFLTKLDVRNFSTTRSLGSKYCLGLDIG